MPAELDVVHRLSGALLHSLLLDQVLQGYRCQQAINCLSQLGPHVTGGTDVGLGAAIRTGNALPGRDRPLKEPDDLGQLHLVWGPGQPDATVHSTSTAHQTGGDEGRHNACQVGQGDLLAPGNILEQGRALLPALGQLDECPGPVACSCGKLDVSLANS